MARGLTRLDSGFRQVFWADRSGSGSGKAGAPSSERKVAGSGPISDGFGEGEAISGRESEGEERRK